MSLRPFEGVFNVMDTIGKVADGLFHGFEMTDIGRVGLATTQLHEDIEGFLGGDLAGAGLHAVGYVTQQMDDPLLDGG